MSARGANRPSSETRRSSLGRVVALLFCLVLATSQARAAEPQVHYTRHNIITIPFDTDPNDKRIQQIVLHVSEDFGKTFAQIGAVPRQNKSFKFTAVKEGWYWFAVQIQDNTNQMHPATIQQLQAGLKICVDSTAPQVTLRGVQLREFSAAVEWDIRDENPDVIGMRLEYRPTGSANWTPLSPPQLLQGQYGWNPTVGGPLEVRMQVKDKAGNPTEQVITVLSGQANPGPAPNPNPNPLPGPGPGPGPAPAGESRVLYVNKRQVNLNYKLDNVGKSDVSGVEVWYTEDGRGWTKHSNAPRTGPYKVELSQERRYGFTLVAVSGVGLADRRPMAGDPPMVWVEVDETRPVVRLLGVDVGQGAETGKMTIRWAATDKHLTVTPIALSYSQEPTGPWMPIEKALPNDGRYVWQMPSDGLPFRMYVRVEAVDRATNVGMDTTPNPIAVDLQVPKATVIGVDPVVIPGQP